MKTINRIIFIASLLLFIVQGKSYSQCSINANTTWNTNTSCYNVIVQNGTLTIDGSITVNVTTNILVWPGASIVIKNGATLNVEVITVANDGKMSVESNSVVNMTGTGTSSYISLVAGNNSTYKGAILNVSHATITGSSYWGGIAVTGGTGSTYKTIQVTYLHQYNIGPARAYFDHAEISGCMYGVEDFNRYDGYTDNNLNTIYDDQRLISAGGIIQAQYSTFKNNDRSIHFSRYTPDDVIGNQTFNQSAFLGCSFVVDNNLSPALPTGCFEMIRLAGAYGIKVQGCSFSDPGHIVVNAAINAIGASHLNVNFGCDCKPYGCWPTPYPVSSPCGLGTYLASSFSGLNTGVEITGIGSYVYNTAFSDIGNCAIRDHSINSWAMNNTIELAPHGGSSPTDISGIAYEGSSLYRISGNRITGDNSGHAFFGIVVNNTAPATNEVVYQNYVGHGGTAKLNYSLQANGDNYDHTYPDLGLTFKCNQLASNSINDAYDITVNTLGSSIYQGIAKRQGFSNPNVTGVYYASKNTFASKSSPPGYNHILLQNPAIMNGMTYHYLNSGSEIPNSSWKTPAINISISTDIACPEDNSDPESYHGDPRTSSYGSFDGGITYLAGEINAALMDPDNCNEDGVCLSDIYLHDYYELTNTMLQKYLHPQGDLAPAYLVLDSVGVDTVFRYLDSTVIHIDTVKMILYNAEFNYSYKIALAEIYAWEGDYSSALTTLANITGPFSLTTDEQNDIDDIYSIIELKQTLEENDGDWGAVNGTIKEWLEDVAESSGGRARYMARRYLHQYEGNSYNPECIEVNEVGKRVLTGIATAKAISGINIYPNPVHDELNILLPLTNGNVIAEVYDLTGRILRHQEMKAGDVNKIAMQGLAAGSYLVKLTSAGKLLEIQNIIKQ